ncbi:MAG: Ig-like domain-containing protein [Pseudomonadota bacterium]
MSETFSFTSDIDPNSIQDVPGAGAAGSVSGYELIGSTITVTFSDGTFEEVAVGSLYDESFFTPSPLDDGNVGGAQGLVTTEDAPAAPTLSVVGETGDAVDTLFGTQVEVDGSDFTLLVEGAPNSAVEILQMDTRLFIASGDAPFGVSPGELPFYANEAMAGKATFVGIIGPDGTLEIPSSLIVTTTTDGTPTGGVNAFVALVQNGDGELSQTSVPLVVRQGAPLIFDEPGVMEFDGTNATVIELAHDAVYEIPQGTVAFSFVAADTSGDQGLFSKDAKGFVGGGNHFLVYLSGDTLKARFQDGTDDVTLEFDGIQAGVEYEIAATFGPDGSGLWVDGNLVASDALYMDWTQNVEAIQWGGRGWASSSGAFGFDAPFEGTISDKQVYGEVLTASQIAGLAADSSGSNAAPIAVDDDLLVDEDSSATLDPLANDSDPDDDTLSVAQISSGPANGEAVLNPDGTITYTPNLNFNGLDSFEVDVTDGSNTVTSTVSVTVDPVNDDPVANDDAVSAIVGAPTLLDVLANDSDPDGDTPVITSATNGASGGTVQIAPDGSSVTFVPADGAVAGDTDTFTYTIDDLNGGAPQTATVVVTVLGQPNLDPVAVADDVATPEDTPLTFDPGANDSDGNGDTVVAFEIFSDPSNGTAIVNGDGTVTYTPNANFNGPDSFEVTVTDGVGGFDTSVVNVTVTPENDPPTANPDSATTSEGNAVIIDLLGNDEDIDGDSLSIQSIEDPANGSVVDNGNGTITYTPDAEFSGEEVFDYTISDGTETSTASVTVTVSSFPVPIFDDPGEMVFTGGAATVVELPHDSIYEIPEGTISYVFNAGDTSGNQGLFVKDASGSVGGGNHFASYLQGSSLKVRFQNADESTTLTIPGIVPGVDYAFAATFGPEGGNVFLDGVLVASTSVVMDWTTNVEFIQYGGRGWASASGAPGFDAPFNGTIAEKRIFDVALTDAQVAELHNTGSDNTDPVAIDDDLLVDEDSSATFNPAANDSDVDGDTVVAVAIASDPANGDAVLNPDGTITYTPNPNYFGFDGFEVVVADGNGGTAQSLVNVTVGAVDDDPIAVDDTDATQQNTAVEIDVLANDIDVDGDDLFVTLDVGNGPSNGAAEVGVDGTVTYTPDDGFVGSDTFDYILSDGDGPTSTATVTVDVTAEEPDPVAFFERPGVTDFDGSSGSVENIAPSSLFEVPEGTIAFSFIDGNPASRQGLFVKDASGFVGGGNHLAIYIDKGDLIARFQDGANSETIVFEDLVADQEYEVAAVFGNGVELWVDGTLVGSDAGFTMDWTQNQEFLQIGGLGWGSSTGNGSFTNAFSGQIADVEIYDERLDSDQIQDLALQSAFDTPI